MPKKIKSKDLIALVEEALLKVRFDTHYDMFKKVHSTEPQSLKDFRLMIADDLYYHCRKLFKEFLDED